jgi:acyl dehydratase
MQFKDLAGYELGTRTVRYQPRDAILYALAIGASATELDLVHERYLKVLPTYALTLGLWAVEAAGDLGVYDRAQTLHVGQRLEVREPLPPAGSLPTTGRITAVWDKGTAAMVEISAECEAFHAVSTIFVPGAGGWGGERGTGRARSAPDRAPDATATVQTSVDQAALYRLTGDLHPIHIDPELARANGFDRPILHGLCTLGAAALGVATAVAADPLELRELSARFTEPVYPGALLDLSVWQDDDGLVFTTEAAGRPVITGGYLRLGTGGAYEKGTRVHSTR